MVKAAMIGMSLIAATMAAAAAMSQTTDDPLLRPIAPAYAARWLTPQPPTRIFGQTWLVGFGGLNVGLIRTSAGLILIDGAVPQAVPAIEDNIRKLGFALKDVKLILSTEPHYDHAGGLAALARDTGATVVASVPATQALRDGHSGADDPQAAWLERFPPVTRIRAVKDGEVIRLGDTSVTAVATPGHTAGSMSWHWKSCEGKRCVETLFASSLNSVAANGYRFSDPTHKAWVASFRTTIARVRALPCGILLSAHPDQSGGDVKLARLLDKPAANPFIDPGSCRAYADKFSAALDKRLKDEAEGRTN